MPAVLEQLRMLRQGRPTNAAVLLFAHDPQRFLPSAVIECTHFAGAADKQPIEPPQVCAGTVFESVDEAMYFVLAKINGAIPTEVVREAIVNAVAHRDYTSSASVQVRLFSDRLEVANPGSLPPLLTLARLRQPHDSVPGNPTLAEPLYLTTYRESRGTGTNGMITRCRKAGLPEPEFKLTEGFLTILRRQPQPDSGPVGGETGEHATPQVLQLVRLLGQAGPLGSSEILERLGLSSRSDLHERFIRPALAAGLIEPTLPDKPNSRLQKYRLTPEGTALFASF
jgi:predicted HTH transcriptional regulator